jgi:hypothetical protein
MKKYYVKFKKERNILHTIKQRKANWIGHILYRNCLLKHVTEGKIQGPGRQGRGHKWLLDDLTETRRYWKLNEEALDHTLWKTHFGRGYRPVIKADLCGGGGGGGGGGDDDDAQAMVCNEQTVCSSDLLYKSLRKLH